ncbi:cation:proton antiporter [Desulfobotulus sp. H1]|uniref:Cation:proton antiporter n=1 Tax=Desulfobotulus pelophilus TaxID=2823377 RepID=A0ABT3N5H0_9BACT|nr:cation:proton antiporter [Desulfobotulus pelophilus]MCW7752700.1 cation:proton antiporter [Desulfobotulus pelophilus]
MESLSPHNILVMLLALGLLLATARVLGELARSLRQPAVLGELMAGILLGPTVLGTLFPEVNLFLFPVTGANAIALDTIATIAIILFLMVAGIEVDLSTLWRQGKTGLTIGAASLLIPFAAAFTTAWFIPETMGRGSGSPPVLFALFLAIGISISALPIIAKTLMDMDLYRSDLGMVVISAAIFNDLAGWIIFAIILSMMGEGCQTMPIGLTIGLTLTFTLLILTIGRQAIHTVLPFVQAYTRWPGGELSFAIILALLGAALCEWIGIHAMFGAFLVGAALGDSAHLRERTRFTIDHFVSYIFAPIFFASIGLKVNFISHFDLQLVLLVTALAVICKVGSAFFGARWGGMRPRESLAAGFSMVSVGAMGIIVGLLALEAGIIEEKLFVALVIMAMGTSMISGPMIRITLQYKQHLRLADLLTSRFFISDLKAHSPEDVIREMVQPACEHLGLDTDHTAARVWERESTLRTGIGNGIAIPHARLHELKKPVIIAGISRQGIDFDAPDDQRARILFLILTPVSEPAIQLTIVSEIAGLFRHEPMLQKALQTTSFTDFLALMRTESPDPAH